MQEIAAIDTMYRPFYARPRLFRDVFQSYEFQIMAETTFRGVRDRYGIEAGEEWKVLGRLGNESVEETLAEMDAVGVEYLFMDQGMLWSRHESTLITMASRETLRGMAEASEGRIIPGVGYNPRRIDESLRRLEEAVEEWGFGYVWFHPMTFGHKPSDAPCYPLYAKCSELGVPVCFQTGQSAEPLPSEPGRPMYADEVAMDFPDLTMVLTHTGWPWVEEWCSMLWRHPNVYGNIGAYYPSFLPGRQVEFIDGRLRRKVLWATNGLGLERCKREFLELPLSDRTRRRVLRENALEVFDLPSSPDEWGYDDSPSGNDTGSGDHAGKSE